MNNYFWCPLVSQRIGYRVCILTQQKAYYCGLKNCEHKTKEEKENMNEKEETKVAKVEPTYSQRFTNMVVKEFSDQVGVLELTPYQQRLAQHMFIGIDAQLKTLETKRTDQNKPAIVWQNINMAKLAIDAVHRVELGLDALIPNHIHPVPHLNSRTKLYDLRLDIGYVGKDYYKRKMAITPPLDIRYRLVHKNDKFIPIYKDADNKIESYKFKPSDNPFDRGEVIGGFGYIIYGDEKLNKLIVVPKESFDKSEKKAQTDAFWGPYKEEMQMVALVRRVTSKINIDPEKVNASYLKVEIDEVERNADLDIKEGANKEEIDIETGEVKAETWEAPEFPEEKTGAPLPNSGVEDTETTPAPDYPLPKKAGF